MTEKASADDFQVQDFVKKKKKKRKHKEHNNQTDGNDENIQTPECSQASSLLFEDRAAPSDEGCKKKKKKRKHKEHNNQTDGNDENIQTPECSQASPLLFEDIAALSDEGCKKKKKKKKKKKEEPQPLVENSCVEVEHEISNETQENASPKKKKKRKHKDSTGEQSDVTCVTVNQHNAGVCEEVHADYVYVQQPVKKKQKLPVEVEVCELPVLERQDETDDKIIKKKKKKKKSRSSQDMQEYTDVTIDQTQLSPPEQNRQEEDTGLPSPKEEGVVAAPQQCHEDGDCDAAVMSEDSTEVPAKFSKSTKAPDGSPRKTPVRAKKVRKSSAFVMEESSSESDVKTPEPKASKRKKDQNSSITETAASDDEDDLDHTMYLPVNLDTVKQELEEFIPHVRNISDNSIRKMAGRDLARFKQFKKQGIAVKFGRFSQKENDQIRKNVEDFLSITGIDSAEKLLFTSRYPEDKETIHRLKAEHLFCEKLSEGIPRPWRLIYYRARKMFDPNNYKGRYTNEEKEKLKKYHAMHGNDWKKISEMMSRSNLSVAMKYSEIKSAINYGPWSKEETRKLMHAVEEVLRKRIGTEDGDSVSSSEKSSRDLLIDREKLYQKLPWTEIEAKVGTRYWRQCKQKWTTVLTNKMTKGQQLYRGTKGLQAKINLIKRLHEMKVEDANDINWEELSNIIGNVPKAYVQAKFYKLKVSCVPLWQKKTFSEIIDYLFKKKLPELEESLEKKKRKQLSSDSSTAMEQRKAFRLSDIFDSSEESD